MSLAQVGGMELTRQAVHLIETGKVRPSMRSLRVLANRLQVPVTALLAPSDSRGPFDQDSVTELDRLCRQQQYEQALARGHEILEWSRSPELVASAHHFIGEALCGLDRPHEAMEHLRQAHDLFETLDADDQGRVAETMELEALALQIAEDPRALTVAQEALRRYRTQDNRRPEVESRLLQRLGAILAARMEYRAAQAHYTEALQVAGGVRDLVRLARLYHGLAVCHHGLGDVRKAVELLMKSHTLYEAEARLAQAVAGNDLARVRSDLARVENDLAFQLIHQGDLVRAEEFVTSALRRFEQGGFERRRSHTLLTLAALRQQQGRLDEAAGIVRMAIDLAGRLDETQALAAGYRYLGEVLAAMGESEPAAASFHQALAILRAAGMEGAYAQYVQVRDRVLSGKGASEASSGTIA